MSTTLDEERVKDNSVQWLLHNHEPWESVVVNWDKSREFRLRELKAATGNIGDIFEKWPVLQQSRGLELVCIKINNSFYILVCIYIFFCILWYIFIYILQFTVGE